MDVTCLKSAINTANRFEMLPNLKDSVDSNSSIEKKVHYGTGKVHQNIAYSKCNENKCIYDKHCEQTLYSIPVIVGGVVQRSEISESGVVVPKKHVNTNDDFRNNAQTKS